MPFRVTLPLVLVALFPVVGLVADRRADTGNPDGITIVSSLPRSGSARGQTDTIVNGIKLAFKEVGWKVRAGDRDYDIKYLDLDDATAAAGQWTIEQEIANANQAKADPDTMAYIGTYNSGAATVSMPILNRAGLWMISPANTAPSLTKPGEGARHEPMCYRPTGTVNYTRCIPTDDAQSAYAAQWCKELGVKKISILDDGEVYGKGIATRVRQTCEKIGIQVLGQQSIDVNSQEFTSLMTTIKATNPDLVYFGGTTQTKAGQVVKDMKKVGLNVPVMAPDGCYEQALIDSAGRDAFKQVPFYVTFGGLPIEAMTEGRGKEFVDAYTRAYGVGPKEAYATYGYECALAVLEAIRIAGKKDRAAILKAGVGLRDFNGATGTWSFDENGDRTDHMMSGNNVDLTDGGAAFKFVKRLTLPK